MGRRLQLQLPHCPSEEPSRSGHYLGQTGRVSKAVAIRGRSAVGCSFPDSWRPRIFLNPMKNINELYGYLRIMGPGTPRGRRIYWRCRCEARFNGRMCNTVTEVRSDSLKINGGTQSCGCLRIKAVKALGHHHQRGERFNRLVIIRQCGVLKTRGRVFLCQCQCGRRVKVQGRHLRDGRIQSCGCWFRESRTLTIKHGQARSTGATGSYRSYTRKKSLCSNPNGRLAQYFYDRGVKFLFASFADFFDEVGIKPSPDHWLVRINGSGNFESGNVEWVQIKRHTKKRKPRARDRKRS